MSSRWLLVIACASLAVSGCSSAKPGSTGENTAANAAANGKLPDCPSAATLMAELGNKYLEAKVTGTDPVRVCMYMPGEGSKTGNAIVRFQGKNDHAQFAATKAGLSANGQTAVDLPGFLDEAYSSTATVGTYANYTVVARKGTVEILVTSQASIDKEKSLITKLLS